MALRLQIISRHRQSLGERAAMEFGHNGGTIGRSHSRTYWCQNLGAARYAIVAAPATPATPNPPRQVRRVSFAMRSDRCDK